jgi:hypothetical protein
MTLLLLLTICFSTTDFEYLYIKGEYVSIIEQAPFALLDTTLSHDEIIETNKFYGFSLAVMGRKEAAIKVFQRILDLKTDFTLDPVKVSPKIINVFNEARSEKILQMTTKKPIKDTVYVDRQIPITILIPGIYQVQRNKKVKGYCILAAEVLSLSALGISQYNYQKSHNEYLAENDPKAIDEKYNICNGWYKKRTIFISTSMIIWLYNIFDVLHTQ